MEMMAYKSIQYFVRVTFCYFHPFKFGNSDITQNSVRFFDIDLSEKNILSLFCLDLKTQQISQAKRAKNTHYSVEISRSSQKVIEKKRRTVARIAAKPVCPVGTAETACGVTATWAT